MTVPNALCSVCNKEIHKRLRDLTRSKSGKVFCSKSCYGLGSRTVNDKSCLECGNSFRPRLNSNKYCTRSCAAKQTRKSGLKLGRNQSQGKLEKLKNSFDFDSCMVEGCDYNTLYEIHRLVEGRDGGEYVIGNMFAICPNHHAEVTRGFVTLTKVNDQTLIIKADTR